MICHWKICKIHFQFVQIEAIISAVLDEYPRLRAYKSWATFFTCLIMFFVSMLFVTRVHNISFIFSKYFNLISLLFLCFLKGGMYFLQLFDWYAASISVILVCLCEVIIVGWIYGVKNFIRDIEFMIGARVEHWWLICWKYTTPIILSV